MAKILITILGLLVFIRGIRIYSRTGLKGELLIGVAGFIFMLAYQTNDIVLGITGYITINVGILLLYRIEKANWKGIFGKLSSYDRFMGNVPQILNKKESQVSYKVTGIVSGILCLLMALAFYRKGNTYNIGGLLGENIAAFVEIGIFVLAGLLLISYYLFKKTE